MKVQIGLEEAGGKGPHSKGQSQHFLWAASHLMLEEWPQGSQEGGWESEVICVGEKTRS